MINRELKIADRNTWGHNSTGYLKRCRYCGVVIYMKCERDGTWRPFESWVAGNACENHWMLHDCCTTYKAAG